jgi:uncharacterized protein (UPF0335 family)
VVTENPRAWAFLRPGGFRVSDTVGIAGDRIRSFIERLEQLETELQELNECKKEVFGEAKGEGFDVKILKEILKLRKQDQDERDEHMTLLETYMDAMTRAEGPATKAA